MSDLQNPAAWLVDAMVGRPTRSGQTVSERSALTLPTYYAIVRNIAEDTAKVPLCIYRERAARKKEKAYDHPGYALLHDAPNPENTAGAFRELMVEWAITHGAGFAEIVRRAGRPEALWPIHPSRVTLSRDAGGSLWFKVRSNNYDDAYPDEPEVYIPQADMFVVRGFGNNGIVGYSLLRVAAEALGLGLALQSYGASFFGGSTAINSVLIAPTNLKEDALEKIRVSWQERYSGPDATQKPAILPPGWDFKRVDLSPEDAQAVESRKFQVEDVARIARMPLSKIGAGNSAGGERESIDYVTDTLLPWFRRIEEEINRKILAPEERGTHYAKHTIQGLMRGDHAARGNFYQTLYHLSAASPNDIREWEDLDAIEGGDTYFAPMNMVPLDAADDLAQAQIDKSASSQATLKNPTDQGGGENNDPPPDNRRAMAAKFMLPLCTRLVNKETKALASARKKHAAETLPAWADEFYAGLAGEAADLLAGPIDACVEMLGVGKPDLVAYYDTRKRCALAGEDAPGADAMVAMIVGDGV